MEGKAPPSRCWVREWRAPAHTDPDGLGMALPPKIPGFESTSGKGYLGYCKVHTSFLLRGRCPQGMATHPCCLPSNRGTFPRNHCSEKSWSCVWGCHLGAVTAPVCFPWRCFAQGRDFGDTVERWGFFRGQWRIKHQFCILNIQGPSSLNVLRNLGM